MKTPTNEIVPQPLISWLEAHGSLTEKLAAHFQCAINVSVCGQMWHEADESLAESLKIALGSPVLLREVILMADTLPVVYARSFVPATSLMGANLGLLALGNASLGTFLFNDPDLSRGAMQVLHMDDEHPLWKQVHVLVPTIDQQVWGRGSVFHCHQQPLMVSEFFLQDMTR